MSRVKVTSKTVTVTRKEQARTFTVTLTEEEALHITIAMGKLYGAATYTLYVDLKAAIGDDVIERAEPEVCKIIFRDEED